MSDSKPRRGWTESIEPGIRKTHRVACRSSRDQKSGRRCDCPYSLTVPAHEPGKTRPITHHGGLAEARALRRRLQSEGRPSKPIVASGPATLHALAIQFFRVRSAHLAPTTIRTHEEAYIQRIAPLLGHLELADVGREAVERWHAGLIRSAPSRRCVVQTTATLRAILKLAVEWDYLDADPTLRLRAPAPDPDADEPPEKVLDRGQLLSLFREGARSLRAETMLRAAGEAGLRRGEVIGLRWGDLALLERRLTVRRSVWQERGRANGGLAAKHAKTTKGRRKRTIPISDAFAEVLSGWFHASVLAAGADASGYVWPGVDGGPMGERSPEQVMERSLARAGLLNESGRPLVTFHQLRHTCATIMLADGVPMISVSRILGHADANVTAKIYAHLENDRQLDRGAEVFNRLNSGEFSTGTLRDTLRGSATPA